MKFPAKTSVDFEIAPAGNHVAFCIGCVDLGIQPGRGQYPAPRHEVYLKFELCNERITYTRDGQQVEGLITIGRTFTASMNEKANLRKFIEGLCGKNFPTDAAAEAFDLKHLVGRQFLLNVTHFDRGGKIYANVSSAAPLPKGMPATEKQHNPSQYFDLTDPSESVFDALPKWLKEKISSRIDDQESAPPPPTRRAAIEPGFIDDDTIPF